MMMMLMMKKNEDGNYCPTGIDQGFFGMDLCAHAGYGMIRGTNTTGSLMCIMHRDGTVSNFVTGTSAPCISLFKPVYIGCSIPKSLGVSFRKYCNGNFVNLNKRNQNGIIQTFDNVLKKKTDIISTSNVLIYNQNINNKQLWWKHEIFHRLYLKYFINDNKHNKYIKTKINKFEKQMFKDLIDEYTEYHSTNVVEHEIHAIQVCFIFFVSFTVYRTYIIYIAKDNG